MNKNEKSINLDKSIFKSSHLLANCNVSQKCFLKILINKLYKTNAVFILGL